MNDSPLLLDYRKGSVNLALYEPIRSLLTPCLDCSGDIAKTMWRCDRSGIYHQSDNYVSLCSCHGTGRTLSTLPSGDVAFVGSGSSGDLSIGIEIKETTELLSSLISGRLQDTQMRGMMNDYDQGHRWILSYGLYRPSPLDGMIQTWREGSPERRAGWYTFKIKQKVKGSFELKPIPYSYLEAFKCCSGREYGFAFDRVSDIREVAQWVGILYHTWTRPYHTHKSMQVFDKSQDVRSRLRKELTDERVKQGQFHVQGKTNSGGESDKRLMDRAAVFSQFPNIGYERSVAAAKHFQSIRDGVNAGVDEWSEVEVVTKSKSGSERVIRLGRENAAGVIKFVS